MTEAAAVTANIQGRDISVKGPKGQLGWTCPGEITVKQDDGNVLVERPDDSRNNRALHGLSRSLISNMVTGVTDGFKRELQIIGVGYRAESRGSSLVFSLGYSHPVEFSLPEGVSAQVDKKQTNIVLEGIDKQLVGQVAANIRRLRPPDPYKGKGVRYADEHISLKAGKAGK